MLFAKLAVNWLRIHEATYSHRWNPGFGILQRYGLQQNAYTFVIG
jgi:hypothetical protein